MKEIISEANRSVGWGQRRITCTALFIAFVGAWPQISKAQLACINTQITDTTGG
jgi:hypothetical protein